MFLASTAAANATTLTPMPTREYIGQSAAAISGASTATTATTISAYRQRHVIASATEKNGQPSRTAASFRAENGGWCRAVERS